MAPPNPEVAHARARLAAALRHHRDQPELTGDARRDLRVANAAAYVQDLVDAWPPLSAAQRNRLAVLLLGGGDGDAAPATPATVEGDDDAAP
jgi:hypothetical protein